MSCLHEDTSDLATPSTCTHPVECCRTQTLTLWGTGRRHFAGCQKHSNLHHQELEQGRCMQAPDWPDRNTYLDLGFRKHSLGHRMACMHSVGYRAYTSLLLEMGMGLGQGHRMLAPLPPSRNTCLGHHCRTHSPGHCKGHRNSEGCLSYTSLLVPDLVKGLGKALALGCRLAPLRRGRNTCWGHHCHKHSLGHHMVCMHSEDCHACTSWCLGVQVVLEG